MNKKAITFVIICSLLLGALGSWVWQRYIIPELNTVPFLVRYNLAPKAGPVVINTTQQIRVNEGSDTIAAVQTVQPWTVAILSDNKQLVGGGLILTSDGLVATTADLGKSQNISIKLFDGTLLSGAAVAAKDPGTPLVFLQVKASGLPTANFGNPGDLRLSQRMLGLVPDYGQQGLTARVSFLSAELKHIDYASAYSSDALQGRTFRVDGVSSWGIGTAIFSADGAVQGINSAAGIIPAGLIQSALSSYFSGGKIIRNSLGINYMYIPKEQADSGAEKQGIILKCPSCGAVSGIVPGGPAAKAGLQEGDIIYQVDGTQIDINNNFEDLIAKHKPGDSVRFAVQRGKNLTTFNVTLGSLQ